MLPHLTFNFHASGMVDAYMAMLLSLFCLGLRILACVCIMVGQENGATGYYIYQDTKNDNKLHKTDNVAWISRRGHRTTHSS